MDGIEGMDSLMKKLNKLKSISDKSMKAALIISCEEVVKSAKANCPFSTGTLRDSIKYRIEGNKGIIYSDCEYAAWVEFGTVEHRPQPYMYPAVQENRKKILANISKAFKQELGGK